MTQKNLYEVSLFDVIMNFNEIISRSNNSMSILLCIIFFSELSTSIRREIDDREFAPTSASEQPEILPATTIEIPSLPILEDTTSVVSKGKILLYT